MENYKVLYAEDDEETSNNMTEILSMMFDNVFTAKNGEEALELYKKESPNIIILDIEMPLMNGLEVAKSIRKNDMNVPIVISTAYRDTEYLLEAIELKITTYILKPVVIQDLHRAIKKCKEQLTCMPKETITINKDAYYDISARELYVNNKNVTLTNMEMQFLEYMIKNSNRVITYEEFENCLWEEGMTSAAIRSIVRDLRNHICKEIIKNIPKVGYKLVLEK